MKTVDDYPDLIPFTRSSLEIEEQMYYEGKWLVNLPSGRTLEFDSEEEAIKVCKNPPNDGI